VVTVQGDPGIGKSRLVKEIQRPVVENKGFVAVYITAGQFEI
jgi:predicted ATPase